ncbi:MAG TPA: GDSL-type esterase/lipase family protein [Candidatus Polarisedimenticolia bacterium]|nr:GDSL-type esterase/lipase family protein [Candidatus Polarisedimenticolia bacterium]
MSRESTAFAGRGRHRLFALVAVACGVLFGLVVAEIAVRWTLRYNTPSTVRAHSLQYLPTVYARHRLAPGQDFDAGLAWGAPAKGAPPGPHIVINERGLRGAPIAVPKPAGTIRVVVLGGSLVFDIHADDGQDWPHLASARLRELGHPEVEVINAGVPGHASADALGRLTTQIWMLQPDVVLLVQGWNDLKLLGRVDPDHPLLDRIVPFDPRTDPFQNDRGFLDRLLLHSQVYAKLRTRYFLARVPPGTEGTVGDGREAPGADWAWGEKQFRLDLVLLAEACRAVGARPVFVTEASLATADASEEARRRIQYDYVGFDHPTLVRAYALFNDAVRAVARERDVPLLDLDRTLSGRLELFADHVHTTAAGSRAYAEETAGFLATLLAPGPATGPAAAGNDRIPPR